MSQKKKAALIGLITGFANGLFGSGGGTVAVPAMEKYLKMEAQKAHATAIAVILPLSLLSLCLYLPKTEVVWSDCLWVCVGGLVGGFLGAKWLKKLSGKWLHRIFGLFMLAAAWRLLFC